MMTATPLGATTGFTCSIGGVCVGTTSATQRLFNDLQREINRAAGAFGISSRVGVDGKIGPQTVGVLRQVAQRVVARGPIDPALDNVLIEQTTALDSRDVAAEAQAIKSALERNGAPAAGPAVASIATFVGDIIRAGRGAPGSLPPGPGNTAPPAPSSTSFPVPIDPYGATSAVPPIAPPTPAIVISSPWASWQGAAFIGGGIVFFAAVLGLVLRPRKALGCSCR